MKDSYHFSPNMIAHLLGVSLDHEDKESNNKLNIESIDSYRKKKYAKNITMNHAIYSDRIPYDNNIVDPQKMSAISFPFGVVATLGVLISLIGVLLFSPLKLPSMYRYIGGIFCFILGISIIGSGLISRVLEFLEKKG